jgi:hypothetical protein
VAGKLEEACAQLSAALSGVGRRRSGLSPELALVAVMADGEKIFPYARSVGTEARVNGLCRLLDGEARLVLECARHTELQRRR